VSSFCPGCGNSLAEGERFCGTCGRDSQAGAAVPAVDPAVAFGLPPDTSGKAIFSLLCGVLFVILPFSIPAVIFGHLSLYDIRRSGGRLTGKGLAVAGIILGYLGMALLVGFIGLTIYEARLGQKRIANRVQALGENSVVTSMRTLNTAEIAYSQAHPKVGYTCSLSDLRAAWGISEELAAGHRNGYTFKLQGCTTEKTGGPFAKYQVVASPVLGYPAKSGKQAAPTYCSDQSDVIRIAPNGSTEDCLKNGSDLSERDLTHPQSSSR
jgi:hypothetical protein